MPFCCHAQHAARFVVWRSMQNVLLSCTACSTACILLCRTACSMQRTLLPSPGTFTLEPVEDAPNATQQWHFFKHCVAYMLEELSLVYRLQACVMFGICSA
jgi:hypothetical protein